MKIKHYYLFLLLCLFTFNACNQDRYEMNLSGFWQFALDPKDQGLKENWQDKQLAERIYLPGSLQEQNKGFDISEKTQWTGQIVDDSWYTSSLYEKYRKLDNIKVPFWLNPLKHYVGVAWYQKTLSIPSGWEDRKIILTLERVHWTTTLFVDGKKIGNNDALLTPQYYIIDSLTAGKHVFTLRVDNRLNINVGKNAHSVSDHTQSNWNGVIGKLTLAAKPAVYIDYVRIDPEISQKSVMIHTRLKGTINDNQSNLCVQLTSPDGSLLEQPIDKKLKKGEKDPNVSIRVNLGDKPFYWDEFTPNLYKVLVKVKANGEIDQKEDKFGFREFKAEGTRFKINDRTVFLRGTLESCIFPLTGYPSMDPAYWTKIYQTCKKYGLNHVRFHSWCPPEVAFQVADSLGLYLQVECGVWTEVGSGGKQDDWIRKESLRILKAYGNHPSFCMMAHGNEPSGKKKVKYLTQLVEQWKKEDPRRVYTSSGGWPYLQNADYWSTAQPRIQGWGAGLNSIINKEAPRTDFDFAHIISKAMPTVSHEIGQWCVYPNFKEIKKYKGVLKAKNLEIFQESLNEKGMEDMAEKFLYASGRLQTLCYKADIEAALRTPGFAGFQLLDLHDFPGQGSALVGVLDPFWEEKGYVGAKEYSSFCNAIVPLARFPKLIWSNNEVLDVPLELAHFGKEPLKNVQYRWSIATRDGKVLKSDSWKISVLPGNLYPVNHLQYDLSEVKVPSQLIVSVSIDNTEIANRWNIWVYPPYSSQEKSINNSPYITRKIDLKAKQILEQGGSVLLLTYGSVPPQKGGNIQVGFSSIFWNTAWTRKQAPHTLGICCQADHPALSDFPNDGVSDYQWWDLMSRCNAMVLDDFPKDFRPIIYIIDDWFTNRKLGMLYEVGIGKGKLLVCSADIDTDLSKRPAAYQFRKSLLKYMQSDQFNPKQKLDLSDIIYK